MKDLKLLAEGRTAQVFDWFPEEYIDLEYDRNKAILDFPISAPKLIERVELDGRFGLVFEKLLGDTLLKSIIGEQSNYEKYGKIMSKLHFHIHQFKTTKILSSKFIKILYRKC
jgi:hypothetical protein